MTSIPDFILFLSYVFFIIIILQHNLNTSYVTVHHSLYFYFYKYNFNTSHATVNLNTLPIRHRYFI